MNGEDSTPRQPQKLSAHEREQERLAREAAAEAESDEEGRVNLRRADKARYLREKLDEQQRADEERDR
ncbi:MAG TPA: hypothetical protein VFN65_06615 [Solirubrobacteraceae bacterium]|nr:hypothetical protein [Solirubrobacteraceae bacterium]